MVGAEGQEATRASSSHWESRLLQGHLHRRPDWALWKVGRGEGAGGGGDMWKGKGESGAGKQSPHHPESTPIIFASRIIFSFQRTPAKFRPAP